MSHPAGPVRVFAPGTVSNLGCGYDVFGLALEGPGDHVVARRVEGRGVVSVSVSGTAPGVPTEPDHNAASVAAQAVLDRLGSRTGLALTVEKGLPLAAGLGGSAASAVAGAVATDALLDGGLEPLTLLSCALLGEARGSGASHADNAAPALFGGFVLVPPGDPLCVVKLPTPEAMVLAVVHPHVEIETATARRVLGTSISLEAGVRQWGNTATLVAGLYTDDWELIGRSLVDAVAEPVRGPMVPAFESVKARALAAGACGAGLSGSGPSVFAVCRGKAVAEAVGAEMARAFMDEAGLASETVVSPVSPSGARVVDPVVES